MVKHAVRDETARDIDAGSPVGHWVIRCVGVVPNVTVSIGIDEVVDDVNLLAGIGLSPPVCYVTVHVAGEGFDCGCDGETLDGLEGHVVDTNRAASPERPYLVGDLTRAVEDVALVRSIVGVEPTAGVDVEVVEDALKH